MRGMKYGFYARVSTDDQNPALLRRLKKLERGDTLIVWKLDRIGRSLRDLMAILDDLKTRGVKFQSLTEAIDATTPTGRAMWRMIGVLAELERSLIGERTRAGVEAQRRGVKFERKPKLSTKQIDHARKPIDSGKRREDVAALLNVDDALQGSRHLSGPALPRVRGLLHE
jgi:DNA invertase Pin-like site-specific DNA recombinase